MMDKILISNAKMIDGGKHTRADLLVSGGRIARIAEHIDVPAGAVVIPADDLLLSYGFCDLHVHFREPGQEHKETIRTGALAAAHGGYTAVCAMPNLSPAPDSPDHINIECRRIDETAAVEVLPYATLTQGRAGKTPVDMAALKPFAVAFSDDGSGIQTTELMRAIMQQAAREDVIIAAHCEDNSLLHNGYIHDGRYAKTHNHRGICSESEWGQLQRDLQLALETGCRYHACHLSTRESIALMRQYKKLGARVTCETAPHYLVLCEDDLQEEGRFKMNPPLRSADDRAALIEGILDGTIDAIATDHAPHTAEEKKRGLEGSPFGIVGLETAFPILYTQLVKTGTMPLDLLIDLLSRRPRGIFRLPGRLQEGEAADLALFDVDAEYVIDSNNFLSMGKSTPFDGWHVQGKCVLTLKDGRPVFQDKNVINKQLC